MGDTVLCKDCKHASWNPLRLYSWQCRREKVPGKINEDLVTGPKFEKPYYESCEIARASFSTCGKEGKFWAPKNKKDLFKFIKHVSA
jgi:hypothetical protein